MADKIKSGKKYIYFVSAVIQVYRYDKVINFGNYEVLLNKKIDSYQDIKNIQAELEKTEQIFRVVILNYIFIRVENAK